MTEGTKKAGSYLGAPALFELSHACHLINHAFGETCYLVGSALERPNYRDVDVRLILGDAKFHALFGEHGDTQLTPFWSLLCTSISHYLRNVTGLPVDFQIQSMTNANRGRKEGERNAGGRHPLGMFITSEGPAWADIDLLAKVPEKPNET